jgi:hypothetical protein
MKIIAKEFGYNLLVHGSLNRDMDLIAVPWSDTPKNELNLIKALDMYLSDSYMENKEDYLHSVLPGGRNAYVINMNRTSIWNNYNDAEYYFDISVTPLVVLSKKSSY